VRLKVRVVNQTFKPWL